MPEVTVEGTVDRIRFSNPETGWAVLGMLNGRKRFAAVGELAGVEPGETLELSGEWKDSTYGVQLAATQYRKVRPTSALGIIRFLSAINGVGWHSAKLLVDHWGEQTLEKLEEGPNAAAEIAGIGATRAPAIYRAVTERTRRDNVLMELQSLGVGAALAGKILQWAGEEAAVSRVKADPYGLRELDGVGFLTADQIAGRLGVQCHDSRRIDSGIVYALEKASEAGHCCLPYGELAASTSKLLEITKDRVAPRIDRLLELGRELKENESGIFHVRAWHAEERLASRARLLLEASAEPIPFVEDPDGIELSDEQRAAVDLALGSKFFILTGGPGTGKTTITRAIVRSFLASEMTLELASPTGRAAQRLQEATGQPAATIHRLLEYHPFEGFRRDRDNPLACEVLIVDEVSMLDVYLAGRLLDAVEDNCRVIFVGDADQLPSVGPGRVLCDLIESRRVPTARLTKIFRQAETSHIIRSAHRINRGELPEAGTDPDQNDLFISLCEDPNDAARILIETVTDRIPAVMGFDPKTEIQVLTPMKTKGVLGTRALNERLRDLLNPTGQRILKGKFRLGDRVMQMKNNYRLWVMNGETGIIAGHDEKEKRVYVQFNGDLKDYKYSEVFEMDLAYACTIHKSQGSEYPCVVIALHRYHHVLLQRDLFYTAVTRAKKLAVIIGDARSIARAVRTVGGNSRHTGLTRRLLQPTTTTT